MKSFDVYKLWPIEPVKGLGCRIWDSEDNSYLDFYGGHAVISVGHSHPSYNQAIIDQLQKISFYSNSVLNPLQTELSQLLGKVSGYNDYSLFLSNSGAEANENALKLASFHTGKKRVLAFNDSFHGRTSGAVAATDNPSIVSPFNSGHHVTFVPLNNIESVNQELSQNDYAAVIIEGIQGVAGIFEPNQPFMIELRKVTQERGVILILDEVQSGYGRTGRFFAHQHHQIKPDIITTAKGMGNGFPIGGTLISPLFIPVSGMLGTTFGGNHLACAASISVLKIIEEEQLISQAFEKGEYIKERLNEISNSNKGVISQIRGRGLMIGVEMAPDYIKVRDSLLFDKKVFTGGAKSNVIRLLPPLTVTYSEIDEMIQCFQECIYIVKKGQK